MPDEGDPAALPSAPPVHPGIARLAWLVGEWQGLGVGGYPGTEPFRYSEDLTVTHDGRPFLAVTSRTWLLGPDGERLRPSHGEAGFWRPGAGPRDVELVLADPTGVVEVYVGEVDGTRVELATDLVARTGTARDVGALTRLYGLVDGTDLGYAVDLAAGGHPMQAHVSARLSQQSLSPQE